MPPRSKHKGRTKDAAVAAVQGDSINYNHSNAPFNLNSLVRLKELSVRIVDVIKEDELEWSIEREVEEDSDFGNRRPLGLSCLLTEDAQNLASIGLSAFKKALVWRLPPSKSNYTAETLNSAKTLARFILDPQYLIVGLSLAHNAIVLSRELSNFTNNPQTTFQFDVAGIDLNALFRGRTDLTAPEEIMDAFGIHQSNLIPLIGFWSDHNPENSGLRAWIGLACALHSSRRHLIENSTLETDSRRIGPEQIGFFGLACHVGDRLQALKPKTAKGYFVDCSSTSTGAVTIMNEKFASKVRRDAAQTVLVQHPDGSTSSGYVVRVEGRKSIIQLSIKGKVQVESIQVVGKASRTLADAQCQTYMRSTLDGTVSAYGSKIASRIFWYGTRRQKNRTRGEIVALAPEKISPSAMRLNPSQKEAHDAIVGKYTDDGNVFVITGPPGTGKTSVIAASVNTFLLANNSDSCIYCACASNVAAKNIAQALLKTGLLDFRLIVSADFMVSWHEHLYAEHLTRNTIVSTALPEGINQQELDGLMGSTRVVVCTLSMLSSYALMANGLFRTYKMATLLVDEASQIRLDEYPHIFDRFKLTLKRACFFGDGKQLAPFQSSQVPAITSVFELQHLMKDSLFLNTSYRMPAMISRFISKEMYSGKLLPGENVSQSEDSVEFVNVADGVEESSGTSIQNVAEAAEIIRLVQEVYSKEPDFRVLTPYDAQRNYLEQSLKTAGLPWEDRVFNIDSFQGNEADVLLISVVRTAKLGFLNEPRRSNVMLSRCKQKMVIVTSETFIRTHARNTLLGKLSNFCGPNAWRTAKPHSTAKVEPINAATLDESEIDAGWF